MAVAVAVVAAAHSETTAMYRYMTSVHPSRVMHWKVVSRAETMSSYPTVPLNGFCAARTEDGHACHSRRVGWQVVRRIRMGRPFTARGRVGRSSRREEGAGTSTSRARSQ